MSAKEGHREAVIEARKLPGWRHTRVAMNSKRTEPAA